MTSAADAQKEIIEFVGRWSAKRPLRWCAQQRQHVTACRTMRYRQAQHSKIPALRWSAVKQNILSSKLTHKIDTDAVST